MQQSIIITLDNGIHTPFPLHSSEDVEQQAG